MIIHLRDYQDSKRVKQNYILEILKSNFLNFDNKFHEGKFEVI